MSTISGPWTIPTRPDCQDPECRASRRRARKPASATPLMTSQRLQHVCCTGTSSSIRSNMDPKIGET